MGAEQSAAKHSSDKHKKYKKNGCPENDSEYKWHRIRDTYGGLPMMKIDDYRIRCPKHAPCIQYKRKNSKTKKMTIADFGKCGAVMKIRTHDHAEKKHRRRHKYSLTSFADSSSPSSSSSSSEKGRYEMIEALPMISLEQLGAGGRYRQTPKLHMKSRLSRLSSYMKNDELRRRESAE
jgi:hypothetical protein